VPVSNYQNAYVVDASVLVKWFVDEDDRDRAIALRDLHTTGRSILYVSELTFLEILNAFRYAPKAREAHAAEALQILQDLHLQLKPTDFDLLRRTNAIAWAYKITIYDALYVALAEQLGYPLITADEKMQRRLKQHSAVVPLRELEI
jgi:predicted nucleic acid-binding protein